MNRYFKIFKKREGTKDKVDTSYARLDSDGTFLLIEKELTRVSKVTTLVSTTSVPNNLEGCDEIDFTKELHNLLGKVDVNTQSIDPNSTWDDVLYEDNVPYVSKEFREYIIENYYPPVSRKK